MHRVKIRVRRALSVTVLGLACAAGCADGGGGGGTAPVNQALATRATVISRARPRGVRVDLGGQVHHARGLVRQPDGSYRALCADAPDGSLRVREGTGR